MQVLERVIERNAIRQIKRAYPGTLVRKVNGMGFRGWPDRLFIFPNGVVVFIEFKRVGGKLTQLQAQIHRELKELGHHVIVSDNADMALAQVAAILDV